MSTPIDPFSHWQCNFPDLCRPSCSDPDSVHPHSWIRRTPTQSHRQYTGAVYTTLEPCATSCTGALVISRVRDIRWGAPSVLRDPRVGGQKAGGPRDAPYRAVLIVRPRHGVLAALRRAGAQAREPLGPRGDRCRAGTAGGRASCTGPPTSPIAGKTRFAASRQ